MQSLVGAKQEIGRSHQVACTSRETRQAVATDANDVRLRFRGIHEDSLCPKLPRDTYSSDGG